MKKILFALLAIALLTLVACAPKEAPTTPAGPVSEPTAPAETTPAPAEEAASVEELKLISNVKCADDKISLTVTNNGDKDWALNTDIKIILNGGWEQEPGCDKESLEPGESMTCSQIDFPVVIKTRKNVVVVTADGKTDKEEVYCTAAATTATE